MSKAVQFSEYGGVEQLDVVEVEDLSPGPGEVRIGVRAAGVNPVDWKILHGYMAGVRPLEFPAGLGSELAGVVEAVGVDVSELAVGDEVLGSPATPAYAEAAIASVARLARKPAGVSWEVAGGLPVAAGTAYKTLELLDVSEGETLLVHAASGAVGLAAVQFALSRGARVIGTASEANHELLRSLGAIPVLYGDGLEERVHELAPEGVDAVLDASGRGELGLSVELAGGPERVLTIAAQDAAEHGVRFHAGGGGGDTVAALQEVFALIAAGRFVLPIAATFPLEGVGRALQQSETGHVRGKLVIVPS
jgi:NADPH:quinone reductase-like Zn-dependent oxidoreductase